MKTYDFVVIGGGVVGLTVARELSRRKAGSICLLEKEPEFGLHASGRNSGVLHAGIYYTPDSLKARFCSRGAKAMMAYAEAHGIPMQRVGKVIVGASSEDVPVLKKLYERAQGGGIRVELVDEARLKEIEPEAKTCEIALYSPDTAIIDSKATLKAIAQEVLASGVTVIKSSGALRIRGKNVITSGGTIAYGHLINAAGLHADKVAHAMGAGLQYSILPFKGIYHKLRPELAPRFRGLIYPAPDLSVPFLGVHTVKTTAGDVMAGPTAIPAFGRENYGILSGIDGNGPRIGLDLAALFVKNTGGFRKMMWQEVARYDARNFLKAVQTLVPFLRQEDLLGVGKIGLRAQLFNRKEKKLVMDFVIEDGPHSTHVLNAISPAFTSSMVFAEMVADRVTARG